MEVKGTHISERSVSSTMTTPLKEPSDPFSKDDIRFSERSVSSAFSSPTIPQLEEQKVHTVQDIFHEHKLPLLWGRIRRRNLNAFSEFFGTFIFLLFSFGVMAQTTLSENKKGDYVTLCLGWGVGIMLGAYTAAPSGGHLNPAVTLSMCIFRKFPWRNFPIYALAQTLGAFCAAGVVFANYKNAIAVYEGGPGVLTVLSNHSTAGIFATSPAPFMSTAGAFFSEYMASAVLMFCIFALTAEKHGSKNLTPVVLGFVFIGIAACFGWETGFAINMARDFGPRVMLSLLGYGSDVWTQANHYFWIPIIAPFLGCVSGGFVFDVFLHEDESPVNTPFMGLKRLIRRQREQEGHIV